MSDDNSKAIALMRGKRKDSIRRVPATQDGQGPELDDQESKGILKQCQELALDRLGECVAAIWSDVQDTLLGMAKENKEDKENRDFYLQGADKFLAQGPLIQQRFLEELQTEFEQRATKSAREDEEDEENEQDDEEEYDIDSSGLSLVDDDDLHASLRIKDLATKVRSLCDKELRALDQRVVYLLKDPTLKEKNNPLGPESIYSAFEHACDAIDAGKKLTLAVLSVFDQQIRRDIEGIYKDINALLVQHGILTRIRLGYRRPIEDTGTKADNERRFTAEGSAAAPAEEGRNGAARAADDDADTDADTEQDLFAVLQSMMIRPPAGGPGATALTGSGASLGTMTGQAPGPNAGITDGSPGTAAPPVRILSGQDLMGALTQIQLGNASVIQDSPQGLSASIAAPGGVNILHDIKATSFGKGMGEVDSMTLDIVAMLFDQILADKKIPDAMKVLIGRLQIPVLKTAILDKALFQKKTHPARRLLNKLGEIGQGLGQEFQASSPLFKRIDAAVQRLIGRFEEDFALFEKTEAVLNQLVETENRRITEEAQRDTRLIENREKLQVGRAMSQREVMKRLKSRRIPPALKKFLVSEWIKLLLMVYAKVGPTGAAWKSSLEIMDKLIWSVEPKASAEDQRSLATSLPALLKHLERGMQLIGTQEEVRTEFLTKLMRYHTEVISGNLANPRATALAGTESRRLATLAQASGKPRAAQIANTVQGGPSVESDDDTQPSESLSPAQSLTVNNPFGEGQIEVEEISLDFLPALGLNDDGRGNTAPAQTGDKYSRKASNMTVGTWVEMRSGDNAKIHARLSWVSPLKGTFLFTNRIGSKVAEMSIYLLAKELREGNCAVIKEVPLFDRAMSALIGVLRKHNEASNQGM